MVGLKLAVLTGGQAALNPSSQFLGHASPKEMFGNFPLGHSCSRMSQTVYFLISFMAESRKCKKANTYPERAGPHVALYDGGGCSINSRAKLTAQAEG